MASSSPSSTPPYKLTATAAASAIRANTLTVTAYAHSLLSHIKSRNAAVKAWAHLDEASVLAQAAQLDSIPAEERGPLHGVSIGVKDIIYTKDMPTEHGSGIYAGVRPGVDAGSIMVLREAGALILGKTATTEFAATVEGPGTRNPHCEKRMGRTPGGSSSGSGAAVADFQVAISLGTQTAGSVIRPASFNGVYAMKPTWGAVTRDGQKVYSLALDTLGWYARSVADLELVAGVLGIQDDDDDDDDGQDDETKQTKLDLNGAKFGFVKTVVWDEHVEPGTEAATAKAIALLRSHGAEVEEMELPEEAREIPTWHSALLAHDGKTSFLPEYRLAKSQLSASLVSQVEDQSPRSSHAAYLEALDGIAAARPAVDRVLSKYAAVLTPSVPGEAPVGMKTGSPVFNLIWTSLHVPVVNMPGFGGEHGMPIGVSLVAPRFHDRRLLRVCEAVGQVFEAEGGWKTQLG
ncbi:amidase signature domain-containing protein [Coniella lustricola]|uniref:Amidase signature domain-containing protein n=1 Tax=Coniella lustricola TaxID=2025994 RepID=A0A2T3AAB0_9PEZI|nr:amidase signature domain-containing protein [Coniella lustricola]